MAWIIAPHRTLEPETGCDRIDSYSTMFALFDHVRVSLAGSFVDGDLSGDTFI